VVEESMAEEVHAGAGEEMELTGVKEESELKGVNFAKLAVGKLVVGAEQVEKLRSILLDPAICLKHSRQGKVVNEPPPEYSRLAFLVLS
jgi:hypothetical protein